MGKIYTARFKGTVRNYPEKTKITIFPSPNSDLFNIDFSLYARISEVIPIS